MGSRNRKNISDCIRCRSHVMQTSCAVICAFFNDSLREIPMVLCDDPSMDYIEECPGLLRNAMDTKKTMRYFPRTAPEKTALSLMKKGQMGRLVKLFG